MACSCAGERTKPEIVSQLLRLYEDYGSSDYIGEAVTQVQHALQAADNAEEEGYKNEVILGAFFHDIGHLQGEKEGLPKMVTGSIKLGVSNHAEMGQKYLESLGVVGTVSQLVGMHVQAKRYLVAIDNDYYGRLSEASKMTLVHQGGAMSQQEVTNFEMHPLKDIIIRMRNWDEQAKIKDKYLSEESRVAALKVIETRLLQYLHHMN